MLAALLIIGTTLVYQVTSENPRENDQGSPNYCPRTACGPLRPFIRPLLHFRKGLFFHSCAPGVLCVVAPQSTASLTYTTTSRDGGCTRHGSESASYENTENSSKNYHIQTAVGIIFLITSLLAVLFCTCCIKSRKAKAKSERKNEELQEKIGLQRKIEKLKKKLEELQGKIDELQQENEKLKTKLAKSKHKNDELQQEIDRRKAQYKSDWKHVPLYPDWRKEEFKAVTVTLDAANAHPALLLSENGRRVTWQERGQDLPSSTQRFDSLPCVLGQLHISSGRCYWEVDVGNALSWDLGVCRDNVKRKGRVTMSPQNGFWAIRLYSGEYWAVTSPETPLTVRGNPLKVGIFVDYEDGDVSFFNMTDGSLIFSFPKNTFHGVLRPLFRLWSSDSGSLAICPGE